MGHVHVRSVKHLGLSFEVVDVTQCTHNLPIGPIDMLHSSHLSPSSSQLTPSLTAATITPGHPTHPPARQIGPYATVPSVHSTPSSLHIPSSTFPKFTQPTYLPPSKQRPRPQSAAGAFSYLASVWEDAALSFLNRSVRGCVLGWKERWGRCAYV